MGLLDGIMAIVSGGATGLLGVIAQRLFDHWKLKQENDRLKLIHEHERGMKKLDAEIMAQEWAQRLKVAQEEGETRKDVAESEAFAVSLQSEPKRYSEGVKVGKWGGLALVFADVLRAVVRPGLTLYLAWIATELYRASEKIMADVGAHISTLAALHSQIVLTLLYLFTTCVLWWFGTRYRGKPPQLA